MSFMFNPTNYRDPEAINRIDPSGLPMECMITGSMAVAQSIMKSGARTIGIDGYSTAPYDVLIHLLGQVYAANGLSATFISTDSLWREERTLTAELNRLCMPDGVDKDPTQLYGKLFNGTYEDLMDQAAIEALESRIKENRRKGNAILIVYGAGALCERFANLYERRIWMDVVPLRAILNVKEGKYLNIGTKEVFTYKQTTRRCYFVDFYVALTNRMRLLSQSDIDDYVASSIPEKMVLLPISLVQAIFKRGLEYPFRCKPVYLEGVWGGYYIKRLRNLPKSMKNCAWSFDFIPMEVSVEYQIGDTKIEFPFYTLVQSMGEALMGKESVAHFGRFFPIRFNYDDTFHSNGNMSIQCHPVRSYIRRENGEFDRQDESYYVVDIAQGAKTYIGFQEGVTKEEFFSEIQRSEKEHTPIDYDRYVHSVKSVPGMQFMLPAGTIHASGRNQLILEIGSLTVGSYTYKMYDYVRPDLDGTPRPLHTYHAQQVIQMDRTASMVEKELIQTSTTLRKGEDWEEFIVGRHPLIYFELRNIRMITRYRDDTKGRFHVLSLVDGEHVLIRSLNNPARFFEQKFLDIVVIPADMGPYEIINLTRGTTVTIHKTLLKDGFENDQGQL